VFGTVGPADPDAAVAAAAGAWPAPPPTTAAATLAALSASFFAGASDAKESRNPRSCRWRK